MPQFVHHFTAVVISSANPPNISSINLLICCCAECDSILQRQRLSHMRNARTSRAASLHGTMMKAKEQMTTSAVRVPIWPALN